MYLCVHARCVCVCTCTCVLYVCVCARVRASQRHVRAYAESVGALSLALVLCNADN